MISVKYRTCNCTDLVFPKGVIRGILEAINPAWCNVNSEPCNHWQDVSNQFLIMNTPTLERMEQQESEGA